MVFCTPQRSVLASRLSDRPCWVERSTQLGQSTWRTSATVESIALILTASRRSGMMFVESVDMRAKSEILYLLSLFDDVKQSN